MAHLLKNGYIIDLNINKSLKDSNIKKLNSIDW